MNLRKTTASLLIAGMTAANAVAQPAPAAPTAGMKGTSWEVNVREMPDNTREKITETIVKLKGTEEDRGILNDILQTGTSGLVSGLVEVIVGETYNLMQYNKKQKEEWRRMIQNENNFTDSITSIKGLRDFYTATSRNGALDPSDINFDGIEIRGVRDGSEVIYMSCSIDRDKLDNMFRHSKFNLVIDTLAFFPYQCHLPNVTANGIRIMKDLKKGDATLRGDTILRPGKGGNGFSFDERGDLKIAIDFSIYSSWVNEAIQIHKDVELGKFKFSVSIPDSVTGAYIYSRKEILDNAEKMPAGPARDAYLAKNLVSVEGDCFVVPRSYMPLSDGIPTWGTGEYNIKIKVRESCRLNDDSDKARRWKEDYKRLRQMQKRSGEVSEYFKTLWEQYGNKLVKTTYTNTLTTVGKSLTGSSAASGGSKAASTASAKAATSAGTTGAKPAAGAPPQK